MRDGRCGVLLVADHDLDGDLLGVTLPRQDRMAPVPGRGYLVANGSVDGVQWQARTDGSVRGIVYRGSLLAGGEGTAEGSLSFNPVFDYLGSIGP